MYLINFFLLPLGPHSLPHKKTSFHIQSLLYSHHCVRYKNFYLLLCDKMLIILLRKSTTDEGGEKEWKKISPSGIFSSSRRLLLNKFPWASTFPLFSIEFTFRYIKGWWSDCVDVSIVSKHCDAVWDCGVKCVRRGIIKEVKGRKVVVDDE